MRFSVVINTYNRGKSLRDTLDALRLQVHADFEVIVVNGPSTDDTESVLSEFADSIRIERCPLAHLSKSRNVGIAAASAEVVAFIDDDGIPEPQWLAELAAGYTDARVGGVGGIVYDHTGYRLQYRYAVCDRRANARWDVEPPLTAFQVPGADPFIYLQGTNTSFRRSALAEIGGFDEEIEYYLDETEVCMQLNDRGYRLISLDGAAVHHKFLSSHLRNDHKVLKKPYPVVKNTYYFALRNARAGGDLLDVLRNCEKFTAHMIDDARMHHDGQRLTAAEFESFQADVERGVRDGLERGMTRRRKNGHIPPADGTLFKPYPVLRPGGSRLTLCFVSQEYPPDRMGGIGRFTHELARGIAAEGHEVHVVTKAAAHATVDLEENVWVHRLPVGEPGAWDRPELRPAVRKNLAWAATAHAEVRRIAADRTVDLVSAPVWDCEGLFCHLDDDLKTVLSLHTTLKTVAEMNASWMLDPAVADLIAVERFTVNANRHLTAPSFDILTKVRRDYAPSGDGVVIYHGIPDRSEEYAPRPCDGKVIVLTVGRLEKRKGTDLFLAAAAELLPEFPNAEFVLVGDDGIRIDGRDATYREDFEARHGESDWAGRVIFRGKVTEEQLYAEYAACDVFCLPARYESFGLVLLEAMVFGKPVVAAAAGGMLEVVADGVSGLLAYPESVGSLVAQLRPLLADAGMRSRLGEAGRVRYTEEFHRDVMVRNTVDAYTRMVETILV